MNAQRIVRTLGGRWFGEYGMARCPAHEDRTPSLSVAERDGRVLIHCHAGCEQQAVIEALCLKGLWPAGAGGTPRVTATPVERLKPNGVDNSADRKRRIAQNIWDESVAAAGTSVEEYLRGRGLAISLPHSLRYASHRRHSPTNRDLPAMVAAVSAPDGVLIGIHRTFLSVGPDGVRKAGCFPDRMMLGGCAGGAVRLASDSASIALAEGIETALSIQQATGISTWATLGTSGLRSVILPPAVETVLICADGDDPGRHAAEETAQRFIRECRNVRVANAPEGYDFNDMLIWPDHVVPLSARRAS